MLFWELWTVGCGPLHDTCDISSWTRRPSRDRIHFESLSSQQWQEFVQRMDKLGATEVGKVLNYKLLCQDVWHMLLWGCANACDVTLADCFDRSMVLVWHRWFTSKYEYIIMFVCTVTTFKYVEGGPDCEAPEVVWNTSSIRMLKWLGPFRIFKCRFKHSWTSGYGPPKKFSAYPESSTNPP